jgi:dihydrofolate synthase/folylpolyglutamate synthase
MDYNATVQYINSFINFEKIQKFNYSSSFKLERVKAFLEELGNSHKDLKVVHVAGSKGKGSTCAIAAYILKEAGYKVGLYTSPHLIDFRERIRVLDKATSGKQEETDCFEGMISRKEFSDLIEKIKPIAEKFRGHKKLGRVSFFEVLTVASFLYFKEKKVDFAVLETGLGGRLDATNVSNPLVCGITDLSLEHTDKLGNSLAEIAFEKMGIAKPRIPTVSAPQEKEAIGVIKKVCSEKKCHLYEVGKDIVYKIQDSNEISQTFSIQGPGFSYSDLRLNLIGAHQVENAAISLGMLKVTNNSINLAEHALRQGLEKARWPGRLQVLRKNPYLILDGAQNVASVKALISSIKNLFIYKRLICIFGISSDKDIKGVSAELNRFCDMIILTKARNNPRAKEPISLQRHFSKPRIEIASDIGEALEKAFRLSHKQDLILVTGSLFLVGDVLGEKATAKLQLF